tara:strand:- start:2298 stop:3002 length:705 start_codon:yes stop_codon:yes gene_type:complete
LGAYLAEELAFNPLNETHWQNRNAELIYIEEYMLRNTNFNQEQLDSLHNLLGNNHLKGINHFINTPQEENEKELTAAEISNTTEQKELIEHTLQNLPTLDTRSFKGQLIKPYIWEQLNSGDIYYEKGFFNTVGSLHTAYQDINSESPSNQLYRLIMNVYGKKGHLAHTIHDHGQSEILWSSKSHFKVVRKDYDSTTDTYYMQLNEIETKDITPTARILSSYDGSQIHVNRPSCR